MFSIKKNKQQSHFNCDNNQYPLKLILKPPQHTQQELNSLISILEKSRSVIRVADFGSGTGRLSVPLAQKGYQVDAIDISRSSLKRLGKIAKKEKLKIRTLPKFDKKPNYDAIVGCDILHHVNLKRELKGIYKALKKGGMIAFSEPGAFNPSWYPYFLYKRAWNIERGILQCSYFNLTKQLQTAGFQQIKLMGLGFFPRSLLKLKFLIKINDRLGNFPIIKYFAYRYILTAVKPNN